MPDKKEYIGGDRLTQVLGYIKGKLDDIGTSLNSKVDKVQGKDLSTNDFTAAFKTKLEGIATGAEVNVQSDWDVTDSSSDAFVLHKPTKLSQFTNDIVTDANPTLAWGTKSKVATVGGIEINVTMPANPNTNTTYSLSRDGTSVKLTPSSGTAESVTLDSLLTNLPAWTSNPTDDTYLIRRDNNGSAAYGQVKFSTVWSYIDSKVSAAGYTKNIGTVTSVKVGSTSYSPSSGVVSLPAYPDISTKVSKSGDTMSGSLTFSGSAGIQYQGTKATYTMISFKDNTSDTYGNGIIIGGGGLTIIGSGESHASVASQYSTGGSEDMVVASDGNIYLYSNVNNGYSERKSFTFNTSGDLTVPRYVYANYFNSSATAETPTTDSYLIYANSDGWYRKSTIENIEAINGNYTAWIPVTTSPTAGWRRICKITYGKKGYENGFLLISGGWNNGAPSNAIISICVRHSVASMLLLQNIATDGMIQQVRMVNVSGSTYWIDAYMKAQNNGVSEQYFKFYGNFEISEIQKSATIITDTVTEAANVSLTSNTLKGTVVVSTATNGQEIYASSTDAPVYLKCNSASGTFIGFKNSSNTIMGYYGVKSDNKPYFYSGSAKEIVTVTGATMTGQLKTSFKESVAMGSFAASSTTVPNLCDELRYSSGCCGSVSIGTKYTGSPSTINTGWYNFLWIPHRSGGVNGAASGDNCNYGRLILRGMTVDGEYEIRYASSGISYCREIVTTAGNATLKGKLNLPSNSVAINFRDGNTSYASTVSHQSMGNEALVFATHYLNTSFIFVNGEDSETNHSNDRWTSLTPGLQIKSNKVAIGKLIENGTNLTYALEVNGDVQATNFRGALVGNASTATKATQDGSGNVITTTYLKVEDVTRCLSTGDATVMATGYRDLATYITLTEGKYFVVAWATFKGGTGNKALLICRASDGAAYAQTWEDSTINQNYPKVFSCFYNTTVSSGSTTYLKPRVYTTNKDSYGGISGGIFAIKVP